MAALRLNCRICFLCFDETSALSALSSCGHLFHSHCLLRWLDATEYECCPTCRREVQDRTAVIRIFQSVALSDRSSQVAEDTVRTLRGHIASQEREISELCDDIQEYTLRVQRRDEMIADLEDECNRLKEDLLTEQNLRNDLIVEVSEREVALDGLEAEIELLQETVSNREQEIIEVDNMLAETSRRYEEAVNAAETRRKEFEELTRAREQASTMKTAWARKEMDEALLKVAKMIEGKGRRLVEEAKDALQVVETSEDRKQQQQGNIEPEKAREQSQAQEGEIQKLRKQVDYLAKQCYLLIFEKLEAHEAAIEQKKEKNVIQFQLDDILMELRKEKSNSFSSSS
uniref:RING-type domain-containing protein n=1 Tax=Steinernema glaseri TaxID=37863 RepID=A0A1I7Y7V3_9BILA